MKKEVKSKLLSGAIGAAAGFINGFFGGGGGTFLVPAFTFSGKDVKKAHATAIAVVLPTSLVSAAIYVFSGLYPPSVGIPSAIGAAAGGAIGAFALGKIKAKFLTYCFSALMLYAGIRCLFF